MARARRRVGPTVGAAPLGPQHRPVRPAAGPAVCGAAAVLAVGIVVGSAAPAAAHPFLVRTEPGAGARLLVAPRTVSLQFSESVGEGTRRLTLTRQGQGPAEPLPVVTESQSSGSSRLLPGAYPVLTGDAFVATEPYAGGAAEQVQPLTTDRRTFRIYLPEPMWITLWLDPDGRPARERIVNIGHVIERTFRYPPP